MPRIRLWRIAYYLLFIAFLGTAALNMLQVRGGFLTNYAADLVVPAWLYVASRSLHSPRGRETLVQRTIGRTPEIAALSLFTASTLTEISQRYWPHGVFSGRFDLLDVLAYACGLAACYVGEKPQRCAECGSSAGCLTDRCSRRGRFGSLLRSRWLKTHAAELGR